MTKSQRSDTKRLPFAKLFRWLAIVGFIKLSIFAMILLDFPFPAALDKSPVGTENRQSVRQYVTTEATEAKNSEPANEVNTQVSQESDRNDSHNTSLIMPVQQAPLPTWPTPVRATNAQGGNEPPNPTQSDEKLFSGPDIPLPPPLPAPIAEPGTIAIEPPAMGNTALSGVNQHVLPVPTLGSATVAQAAATMPVPQSLAPTQSLTPVEQQVPLARDVPMPVPSVPDRENKAGPTAPITPVLPAKVSTGADAQELARQQQDMLVLKKQMDERVKELQDSEAKIKRMLLEARGVEGQKLKTLIQMFGNMKPKTAAKALENMDERTACKILEGLTPKQAGDILSYTNPSITAKLTEVLSHVKIK